jgi:hypothetical protein
MAAKPATVKAYLDSLPEDRRRIVSAIRDEINRRLPEGYAEGIQYGMIGWAVPHSLYPAGYHCNPQQPVPFVGLASQKGYVSLYLMCVYLDPKHLSWFEDAWRKTGKRLDMGKSCVRVKRLEDVALDVVGEAVARVPVKDFLARYQAILESGGERRAKAAAKKKAPAARKPAAQRAAAQKPAAKKKAAKQKAAKQKAAKQIAAKKKAAAPRKKK